MPYITPEYLALTKKSGETMNTQSRIEKIEKEINEIKKLISKEQEWITIGELEWLKDATPKEMNWNDAKDWCKKQGGRLPTRIELLDLYDNHKDECKKLIEDDPSSNFWSSTLASATLAWYVSLYNGNSSTTTFSTLSQVRCLR